MVNEKQPFLLRCSVLYCFQCFLYKNETGQTQLIQTLLPQGNELPSLTTGLLNNIINILFGFNKLNAFLYLILYLKCNSYLLKYSHKFSLVKIL